MKQKKYTTNQRILRLEKVVSQIYVMNKMIQDELKAIQNKLKQIDYSIQEEE